MIRGSVPRKLAVGNDAAEHDQEHRAQRTNQHERSGRVGAIRKWQDGSPESKIKTLWVTKEVKERCPRREVRARRTSYQIKYWGLKRVVL